MGFLSVIVFGVLIATAVGYRAIMNEYTRQCNSLTIPQCQGLGYTITPLSDADQARVNSSLSSLLMLDGIAGNTVHRAFLCYTLAPKCRRRESYDVRPCREACEKVFEDVTDSDTKAILKSWDESLNCDSDTLFSTQDDFLCVKYKKLVAYAQAAGADSGSYTPGGFDLTDLGNSLFNMSSALSNLGADTGLDMEGLLDVPGLGNMSLSDYLSATQEMAQIIKNIGDGSGPDSAENIGRLIELAAAMGIEVPDMSEGIPNTGLVMPGMSDYGSMPEGYDLSGLNLGGPYNSDFMNSDGK